MSDEFCRSKEGSYRYVSRFSEEYPQRLQQIKDPPAGIYVKGSLPREDVPSVAIVGSRICSQYGRLAAEEFGRVLAQNGIQIISGLARGIDVIGQKSACEAGGRSFGILGCGVEVIYPKQNAAVYRQVESCGGLISELEPNAVPIGKHFASRNRIIAALSDLVLVIEAKEKSGTQITVQRALEQGKDIYALPGRIHDICSAGCNSLIEQGAGIAKDPETILAVFGIYPRKTDIHGDYETAGLERLEKLVYEKLDFYPRSINEISSMSRLPVAELSNIIFHLQLKGFVKEEGRQYYVKVR